MEKTRVPINTDYWWISHGLGVHFQMDNRMPFDDDCFEAGNYFHTKEEAELMARKLRAVLKGADVIEMPGEEEMVYAKPIDEFYVRPSAEQYETPRR